MKALKITALVFLILLATAAGATLRLRHMLYSEPLIAPPKRIASGDALAQVPLNSADSPDVQIAEPLRGKINVLLVGLDDLEGVSRSDSIALAVFDEENRSLRILSIPRDSRMLIPGRGTQKVNHSYAYGGVELLKKTLENYLSLEIDYFVVLGFKTFPALIDLLGGVEVDVDKKLVYTDRSQRLYINIPKGPQHLSGKTALHYVRFRHDALGDIGRVQRQQKFLTALMKKLKTPAILPKIPSLVGEALAGVNTDLNLIEAVKLAQFANSLPPERIELFMAPGRDTLIDKLSYWLIDLPAVSRWLARTPAAEVPKLEDEATLASEDLQALASQIGKISILNGDGSSGTGKRASQLFEKLGITVASTGNARHFNYSASNVVVPKNGDRQAAEALAKLCGLDQQDAIIMVDGASMLSLILGRDKEDVLHRLERATF